MLYGKAQTQAMIDACVKDDKHYLYATELLLLIDEEDKETIATATQTKENMFRQKSPHYPHLIAAKQVGYTQHVPFDQDLPSYGYNQGYPDDQARRYGFKDLYDVERMAAYLRINGDRRMVAVSGSYAIIFKL